MTRDDLANTFSGIGVELGVAAGDYSETILNNDSVRLLYSIDRWSDHHDEREYQKAKQRLAKYGERSQIIRSSFEDVVDEIDNGFFDFVFIDAYAHTGQCNGRWLREWWPKLKRGGIFAGHDYDPQYQQTIEAVDEFAALNCLNITITDEQYLPSWFCVKP